ncbi:MAG: peptide deformylase [Candidatus Malacoplasma girerdii]|nr:MAG: peptide deformylase [Candidatus Malacoplasma girerdii]
MNKLASLVLLDTDIRLRQKSTNLDINNITKEEWNLIQAMQEYIDVCYRDEYEQNNITPGIAIAAPQVGLNKKVIYIHFNENEIEHKYLISNPKEIEHKYLIANPVIVSKSVAKAYLGCGEGCLSVKNKHDGFVPRYNRIIVEAYDLINKQPITIDATGILAICLQHEIDHLDGKLYYDHINKENPFYTENNWIKI